MASLDPSQFPDLVTPAKSVVVFLPQNPNLDQVACALGLSIVLRGLGKDTQVLCPQPMQVDFNRLVDVNRISSQVRNRNLIITFPKQTEHVDKVTYDLVQGELHLVITPKPDAPELDPKQLKFIAGSSKSDLLVFVGVPDYASLGKLYSENTDLFSQAANSISFHLQAPQEEISAHQVHESQFSSLSELMTVYLDGAGINLDPDSASNFLAGVRHTTDNFSSNVVTATTFEVAAQLMKYGAHLPTDQIDAQDFPQGSIPQAEPSPVTPSLTSTSKSKSPASPKKSSPSDQPDQPDKDGKPSEWYGPKVYKGPMLP